jgi:hypothetical protein
VLPVPVEVKDVEQELGLIEQHLGPSCGTLFYVAGRASRPSRQRLGEGAYAVGLNP